MHHDFSIVTIQGLELLVYLPWWQRGLVHGMTTRSLAIARDNLEGGAEHLCGRIGASVLVMPVQCHGSDVLDMRGAERAQGLSYAEHCLVHSEGADAITCSVTQPRGECVLAYGIMTADCVPIVVRGNDGWVLIHAGWRGLANGVIARGCASLLQPLEAIVFAAAGRGRYEVGPEVIASIGSSCVYSQSEVRPGFYMLDTAETAVKQLRAVAPDIQVVSSNVCTIRDTRFHSFRRDGERAGRGVTFLIPPIV